MTIEDRLKDYILLHYKSLRNFVNTSGIGIPYTTIDGIFKRGIYNSSISNILRLCEVLNISADELAKGNIVPIKENNHLMVYARKLSQLSPDKLNSALEYIEFLSQEREDDT